MIQIKDLDFYYRTNDILFNGLNLQLETGKIYGLLGKNGAGKTSLLKLIAGLLHAKKGEIRVNGINASKRHPAHLASFYMVPEEFILPPVSEKTFLKINAPFYPNFNAKQFYGYLNDFELKPKGKLTGLSYGQKKKFLLSFGLATNAPVLITDEPTNGLDIPSKSKFRSMMASALTENRLFIISTHQVRDIEGLPDNLTIIDSGKIIFNELVDTISEKLTFTSIDETELKDNDVLYSEPALGGMACVLKNTDGTYTKPNTELLFNSLIQKNSKTVSFFQ